MVQAAEGNAGQRDKLGERGRKGAGGGAERPEESTDASKQSMRKFKSDLRGIVMSMFF
jgi:hypothetical protein